MAAKEGLEGWGVCIEFKISFLPELMRFFPITLTPTKEGVFPLSNGSRESCTEAIQEPLDDLRNLCCLYTVRIAVIMVQEQSLTASVKYIYCPKHEA